ncbi:MAG: hypothetical protein ACOC95_03465 [Planctomycetota bacterium]
MFIAQLLLALLLAVIFSIILAYPLGRRAPGPLEGLLFFFLILFLAIWAAGAWVRPVGPAVYDVPWLVFLVVGLILSLILAAASPARRGAPEGDVVATSGAAALALSAFFYVALLALLIAALVSYVVL